MAANSSESSGAGAASLLDSDSVWSKGMPDDLEAAEQVRRASQSLQKATTADSLQRASAADENSVAFVRPRH